MPKGNGSEKVTYQDVIKWFESADSEMAGLVLDIIKSKLAETEAKKAEFAHRMAKARKGRKSSKSSVSSVVASTEPVNGVVADPNVQAEVAAQLPVVKRGPGRPRKLAQVAQVPAEPARESASSDPEYQAYLNENEPEVAVAAQS